MPLGARFIRGLQIRRMAQRGSGFFMPAPSKAGQGESWEEQRSSSGLKLIGDLPGSSSWDYIIKDESRRSFIGYRPGSIPKDACRRFFFNIRDETDWIQPMGRNGPIPRKTAWFVKPGCTCCYRYGGLEVDPVVYPAWMKELLQLVMPLCGLRADEAPNSCNANLYEDGNMSVGWHADDEDLFQGKFRDCRIVSLSFGARRSFELRLNWPDEREKSSCVTQVHLGDGDLCTMEGMTQKHFQHRAGREASVRGARINLTWRWVVKHTPRCPSSRPRLLGS